MGLFLLPVRFLNMYPDSRKHQQGAKHHAGIFSLSTPEFKTHVKSTPLKKAGVLREFMHSSFHLLCPFGFRPHTEEGILMAMLLWVVMDRVG